MDATDAELLATFARNRSEDAFRDLLLRHLGMVFATARRLVGDAHEAEEIAQTVFQLFAEKAGTLDAGQPLAGWLYHAARHHALHRVRSEGRRRQREQLAAAMNPATEAAPPPPPLLAELEDALTELDAEERDALVLRFLEDRQLREVGRELGVSEEAARKRVARALDRLRDVFARRGITASTGAITVALLGQAGVGVPATLGATISTAVLGGTAVVATTALVTETATTTTMNLFNLKAAAAILGAAAVTGTTTYFVQEREADRLRSDHRAVSEVLGEELDARKAAEERIQLGTEQIEALKRDLADLPRLRGEVDRLNRMLERMTSLENENVRLQAEVDRQRLALSRVSMGAVHGANSETDTAAQIYNAANNNIRLVQAAFEQYLLENRGAWPASLGQLEKYVSHNPTEQIGDLDRRYVFFSYPGVSPSDLPADAVLITERDPRPTYEGKYYQAYFLADRSVQVTEGLNQMRRGPNNTLVLIHETPVP